MPVGVPQRKLRYVDVTGKTPSQRDRILKETSYLKVWIEGVQGYVVLFGYMFDGELPDGCPLLELPSAKREPKAKANGLLFSQAWGEEES